MSYTLDELDKKILRILQEDGRIQYSKIAKNIRIGETTVRTRVRRLREKGVLLGFTAIIDPEKVGKSIMAIMGFVVEPREIMKIADELTRFKQLTSVYESGGPYNIMALSFFDHTEELGRLLNQSIYPLVGIRGCQVILLIERFKETYGPPIKQ